MLAPMNRLRVVGAVVLMVVLVILMVQNRESVTTRLLWVEVEMPQSILLLVTALLGFGAGALFAWFRLKPSRPSVAAKRLGEAQGKEQDPN